jgi:hypothetical protein
VNSTSAVFGGLPPFRFSFERGLPRVYEKGALSVRPWPNTTTEHRSFARVMAL